MQEQLPELNIHFRSQSFLTSMYASSWFLTLFLTTFPLPVATRVFDIFMYEVTGPRRAPGAQGDRSLGGEMLFLPGVSGRNPKPLGGGGGWER